MEKLFHLDSYGYRPGKSAIQAIGVARERCWRSDWVLDVDIKGFFDNIDHELLMRAVRKHANCQWVVLYLERWLKAASATGGRHPGPSREGNTQGGVISPLLANLFLHYGSICGCGGTILRYPSNVTLMMWFAIARVKTRPRGFGGN